MQNINEQLLSWFNNLANYSIVENFVYIFADGPIFFLPLFLVAMWIYHTHKTKDQDKRHDLMFIFYACIVWIILSYIVKQFFDFDRPEAYLEATGKLLMSHVPDASFPSDHATVSVAFLASLFLANYKRIGLIFLPFVVIMNLSRIIAWVHWPFDIIAGTFVGIVASCITFKYIKKNKLVKRFNLFIIKLLTYIKL